MKMLRYWRPDHAEVTHAILDIKLCNGERGSSEQ